MSIPVSRPPRSGQSGAITIMVALMLLVLLTLAAIGMSRDALRIIVSSGFERQGVMANNVADSGLEWAVYWLDLENAAGATASTSASNLLNLKLALLQDDSKQGVAMAITDPTGGTAYVPGATAPAADQTLPSPANTTSEGFTIGLTRMGKLPITDISQGNGPGMFTPAAGTTNNQAPDLWAVRSDAQVKQGSVTFTHGKEAWISTPVQ